jgi:hypothetical protein
MKGRDHNEQDSASCHHQQVTGRVIGWKGAWICFDHKRVFFKVEPQPELYKIRAGRGNPQSEA